MRPEILFALGLCYSWTAPAAALVADEPGADEIVPVAGEAGAESNPATEPASPSPPAQPSGWEFKATPYIWMSGMKGDMGVVEQVEPVGVDLSFGDILDALKFTLMGSLEARHGRFVATVDTVYLSMGTSENIEIREVAFVDATLKTKTFISTLTAGYRAVDQDRMSLDVVAGGRLYSMKTSLDLVGPRRAFSGSKTETWVDPVVGASLRMPLGPSWSLHTYGDIGGFGVGSDMTWQLLGVIEYDLSRRWSLSAGWRHLSIDYENDGFVFDASMDGPILGAVYRF